MFFKMKRAFLIIVIAMVNINCANNKAIHTKGIEKIGWSVAGVLPSDDGIKEQPGVAGPVAGIINDHLLIAGGANFPDGMPWRGAKKIYQGDIYLFEKRNGQLINGSVHKQRLPEPIAYCASVTTPQGIIYIGGENEQGISGKVVLIKYNATTNEIQFSNLPSLPLSLTVLSAVYNDNIIYVAGGNSADGNSDKFFSLDLSDPGQGWKTLPAVPVKISFAVMLIQSNGDHDCIYLIGGRRKNSNGISDIFNTVYQFDLKDRQWRQKQSLPYAVSAGTGIAIHSNHIVLLGGDKAETFSKEEKINAAIKNEKDGEKSKQLITEKIALLESHPGFTSDVLLYNTIDDTWKRINSLPAGSPVTTIALKWDDDIIIPTGEIKAGVRTPRILIGKISELH
jgi:N-acetylneuraminate epimerase